MMTAVQCFMPTTTSLINPDASMSMTTPWNESNPASLMMTNQNLNDANEKENATGNNTDTDSTGMRLSSKHAERKPPKVEPLTESQKAKFDVWLEEHKFNMYPSREEKEALMQLLDANYSQVTRLFANHRRRTLHKSTPSVLAKKMDKNRGSSSKESSMQREMSIPASESASTPTMTEDDSIAAICGAVADLVHDDIANRAPKAPSARKRRSVLKAPTMSDAERDAKVEKTVEDILSKMCRRSVTPASPMTASTLSSDSATIDDKPEASEIQVLPVAFEAPIPDVREPTPIPMPSVLDAVPTMSCNAPTQHETMPQASPSVPLDATVETTLFKVVMELVRQPPNALPAAIMANVNPRLIAAITLLESGFSWMHPSILSVIVEYYFLCRETMPPQQQSWFCALISVAIKAGLLPHAVLNPDPLTPVPSPPLSSAPKTTEEILSQMTPEEFLAVNVLTDLANC